MTLPEILQLPREKSPSWQVMQNLEGSFGFLSDYGINRDNLYNIEEDIKNIELLSILKPSSTNTSFHWIDIITYNGFDIILFFSAGRDSDDYKGFHIVNKPLFDEMMEELRKLAIKESGTPTYEDSQMSLKEMNTFHNINLDKEFNNTDLGLKFKVGDIVSIEYDINGENMSVNAEIIETDNKTTFNTYKLQFLDFIFSHMRIKDNNKIYPKYETFDIPNWENIPKENQEYLRKVIKDVNPIKILCNYEEENSMIKIEEI